MASTFRNENETSAARFEAVAMPFMDALYNKALHLTRRPEDANDVVQETYLRAFRTFANFTEGTNCKAWLFTILYSVFINRYRKEQREPDMVSMDEREEAFQLTLADEQWESNFAALSGSELDWQGAEVKEALAKLPESFRTAVLLVDVEGLTYEEAAAVVNSPVGTLRSRLFRARRMLFVELHDYARKMGIIRRLKD
ncbi:MAG: sigma-70 family RNA polymerase sigma factor [Chthoniobacteraceae bacterium]